MNLTPLRTFNAQYLNENGRSTASELVSELHDEGSNIPDL